ncbi:phage Gp37/Gp68 family protein [Saccharopolyspora sp. K220]|uniref:DUF5131 family protein n=1 Tax=Saccharopolyspora soli TaxID=2926618 RepID=UPI001F57A5DB|nr:phage Gp37/Gp68 family protein [Saccharopolyspora soli]MCI2424324.1 phage Gp37/Gp68 family protein [Saccharopolyspora soli]
MTKIEWTDATFNAWWGCARVSPACRFCYADANARRWKHELWRRSGPRRLLSEANWQNPLRWNRAAKKAGRPLKVFCGSMSDVFEIHPVAEVNAQLDAARSRLWTVIEQTPWLVWQLLTKRPDNIAALVPWTDGWPPNVWLGTSVEDNQRAAERIPVLVRTSAPTVFLSCEPLLADLDLSPWLDGGHVAASRRVDWVIAGGESGPKARPMHPDWARSLRDQCTSARVPFFFKQWGEWAPVNEPRSDPWSDPSRHRWLAPDGTRKPFGEFTGTEPAGLALVHRVRKKAAGRVLDGRTWNEFPTVAAPATC